MGRPDISLGVPVAYADTLSSARNHVALLVADAAIIVLNLIGCPPCMYACGPQLPWSLSCNNIQSSESSAMQLPLRTYYGYNFIDTVQNTLPRRFLFMKTPFVKRTFSQSYIHGSYIVISKPPKPSLSTPVKPVYRE